MNVFTIRDIENLCGIKAHTLRVWEQRYQLHTPKRKASNHRLYDDEDLKYLLRIAFLYHNGHKISRLARLPEEEICRLALKVPLAGGADDIFINHLIEAALDFDQELFDRVLHNIILHMGLEKAVPQVIYPFLHKIGLLWLTGNVVPAQEHFASTLIIKKLLVSINGLENPPMPQPGGRLILLFTPQGELHEIPLLYMRYLLKKNGQPAIYFGRDIDLESLCHYCGEKSITHLYFHLITRLQRDEPSLYLKKLQEYFPTQQIVISGKIGLTFPDQDPLVRILKSFEELQAFAKGQ
ncbi:MAG: MerR family transcriptional regulator [Bacteroidetes bacterium]|nr:MerR family transcriptional regulator [Bacteroidota bacterium]